MYNIFQQRRGHRHLQLSVRSLRLLFAMATPVQKTFTTNVGEMQRRRHYMIARGVKLSSLSLLFFVVVVSVRVIIASSVCLARSTTNQL